LATMALLSIPSAASAAGHAPTDRPHAPSVASPQLPRRAPAAAKGGLPQALAAPSARRWVACVCPCGMCGPCGPCGLCGPCPATPEGVSRTAHPVRILSRASARRRVPLAGAAELHVAPLASSPPAPSTRALPIACGSALTPGASVAPAECLNSHACGRPLPVPACLSHDTGPVREALADARRDGDHACVPFHPSAHAAGVRRGNRDRSHPHGPWPACRRADCGEHAGRHQRVTCGPDGGTGAAGTSADAARDRPHGGVDNVRWVYAVDDRLRGAGDGRRSHCRVAPAMWGLPAWRMCPAAAVNQPVTEMQRRVLQRGGAATPAAPMQHAPVAARRGGARITPGAATRLVSLRVR
jgi:hypothetical protein